MSAATTLYKLYRHDAAEGCSHDLLLRVRRPGAANADEGAVDAAGDFADSAAAHLRRWWERWYLARRCPREHRSQLIGEMQDPPVGEALYGPGLREVQLWVAPTRYGAPWVVLGTAPDEAAFWAEVEDDDDLASLGPQRPARLHTAFFLTDRDGDGDLS